MKDWQWRIWRIWRIYRNRPLNMTFSRSMYLTWVLVGRIQILTYFSINRVKKFCECFWRSFGKDLLMHHANVSLKAASFSHAKLIDFTSQLICHSFEKNVRVVTILYYLYSRITNSQANLCLYESFLLTKLYRQILPRFI